MEPRIVWQNECCLVYNDQKDEVVGEMGLCYPNEEPMREVQVAVRETGGSLLMDQLRGQSVRITIEVVPGGNR